MNNSSETSEPQAKGGSKLLGAAAIALALCVGLLKKADDLVLPFMRSSDDISRGAGRYSAAAGEQMVRHSEQEKSLASEILVELGKEGITHAPKAFRDFNVNDRQLSSAKLAAAIRFKGEICVSQMSRTYSRHSDGSYHLSAKNFEFQTKMKRSITAESKYADGSLPELANEDFDYCRLKQSEDGKVYLTQSMRRTDRGNKPLEVEVESEVEFVSGDWTDYELGKDVTIRFTAEGLLTQASFVQKQLEKQLDDKLVKNLRRQVRYSGMYEVELTLNLPVISNETIVVGPESMEMTIDLPIAGTYEIAVQNPDSTSASRTLLNATTPPAE